MNDLELMSAIKRSAEKFYKQKGQTKFEIQKLTTCSHFRIARFEKHQVIISAINLYLSKKNNKSRYLLEVTISNERKKTTTGRC